MIKDEVADILEFFDH